MIILRLWDHLLISVSAAAIESSITPPLLQDQQQEPHPSLVPPNLYVDTPTKTSKRKHSFPLDTRRDQHCNNLMRPTHLSLDMDDTAETEV